jgi:hypothetical protein
LGFAHLVAGQAQLRLRLSCTVKIGQRRIVTGIGRQFAYGLRFMTEVAIGTDNPTRLVRAAFPKQPVAPFVTRQAGSVSFIGGIARILGETNRNGVFAAAGLNVCLARTVTGLAAELLLVVFRVRERFTHNGILKMLRLILMANHAGVATGVLSGRNRLRGLTSSPL